MIIVRALEVSDFPRVSEISAQLGYPATSVEVAERFANIRNRGDHFIRVACGSEGAVIGWVHAHFMERIQVARYADVAALVVDQSARRQGAARALMQAVEDWARGHHLSRIRLRSGQQRTDAHAFYEAIGYRHVTTPKAFEKTL
ncbi:MAG: GNAT family N-acetyltransferase [Betaproteobacteria bacterium]|nr:GNAT family N-acetyltransferase [Betaproteobacteria bacterium]